MITYNNYKKTLDLKAPNQETKNRWIEVLNNVLNTARQQNKAKDLDWTEDDAYTYTMTVSDLFIRNFNYLIFGQFA